MPVKFTLIGTNVLMHVCSIDATCEPKARRRLGRLVNHSRKVTARPLFYRHMGHSREINKNIHQTPLVEAEILCVGDKLKNMDGQLPSSSSEALSSQSVHDNCNESAASCSYMAKHLTYVRRLWQQCRLFYAYSILAFLCVYIRSFELNFVLWTSYSLVYWIILESVTNVGVFNQHFDDLFHRFGIVYDTSYGHRLLT